MTLAKAIASLSPFSLAAGNSGSSFHQMHACSACPYMGQNRFTVFCEPLRNDEKWKVRRHKRTAVEKWIPCSQLQTFFFQILHLIITMLREENRSESLFTEMCCKFDQMKRRSLESQKWTQDKTESKLTAAKGKRGGSKIVDSWNAVSQTERERREAGLATGSTHRTILCLLILVYNKKQEVREGREKRRGVAAMQQMLLLLICLMLVWDDLPLHTLKLQLPFGAFLSVVSLLPTDSLPALTHTYTSKRRKAHYNTETQKEKRGEKPAASPRVCELSECVPHKHTSSVSIASSSFRKQISHR